jgi:hypothetical protein
MDTLPGFDLSPDVLPTSEWCQRWRPAGYHVWRHMSGPTIQPHEYTVRPIAKGLAKAFVQAWHYSHSYPADRLRFGLYRGLDLVGVAAFGIPVSRWTLPNAFPTLEPMRQSLELSRFILTDDVPANGETWFLARAFEGLREAGVRGVVSHSDPCPRRRQDGSVLYPGHIGTIYQAANAIYAGRTRAREIQLLPDATVANERSLQKARSGERNAAIAIRQLEAHGAIFEGDVDAALAQAGAETMWHTGQHRYLFPLDRGAKVGYGLQRRGGRANPAAYPKATDAA